MLARTPRDTEMLLRPGVLVYFREMKLLRSAAACRYGDANGCVLAVETDKSDVAIIATIGPDKEERIKKPLDDTFSSGTPHDGPIAFRALVHSLGE